MFSIAKESNTREIYSRVLTYFVLVAMFVVLALSALSKELVAVMSTPAFHDAYKVVHLIALSYTFYGCYYVLAVGINLEGKTKYVALVAMGAALLNLGLNYWLITRTWYDGGGRCYSCPLFDAAHRLIGLITEVLRDKIRMV